MQRELITYLWIACKKSQYQRKLYVKIIDNPNMVSESGSTPLFSCLTSSPYFELI